MSGRGLAIALIVAGPVCGLAATDLILPAIPMLPDVLTGTAENAQWVLAAFALGTGFGLLIFGELGGRYPVVNVLVLALFAFATLSFMATRTTSLSDLSVVRFLQGIAASAPAIYAPLLVTQLYSSQRAVVMLGRLGSIESMAPAIAPIVGAWLLNAYGWRSSFYVIAVAAIVIALGWLTGPGLKTSFGYLQRIDEGYLSLAGQNRFMRYAISQACTLGALLIIVFAAPKVIVSALDGTLSDFVTMQVLGIVLFVISANMAGTFTRWWGNEKTIFIGSFISAVGCAAILMMALLDLRAIPLLWVLFMLVNVGLGIRGPAGFFQALEAAGKNDSRGSALVILFVMLITAAGTAIVAHFIEQGLLPVAIAATAVSLASVVLIAPGSSPTAHDAD